MKNNNNNFLVNITNIDKTYNFLKTINYPAIIALEGKCGSGKTTLANNLQDKLDLTIIPIDDFFLPPELKTKERLNEIGGNIDYERIFQLLEKIQSGKALSYKKYDCKQNIYIDKKLDINKTILLEGVYSYHQYFRKFINKLIYLEIDEALQMKRLKLRDNYNDYINKWIPLENKYFEKENIKAKADLII